VAAGQPRGRRRTSPEARQEAHDRRAATDDADLVVAAAARLLEARPRSVADVRVRLTRAGYRADLVEAAMTLLAQLGYLDDEEFARAWVASRDRAHPRGERALRMELARAGVDRAVADAVLGERAAHAPGPTDDADEGATPDEGAALRLLERRKSALDRVAEPRRRRERAYGLLARAGFDPDTASRAIARFTRDATYEGPPRDV
jgi:SOS response regulatory protein OraA/RecX